MLRPRAFWDGGDGRAAFATAGTTWEDRDGGTLDGAVLPATGAPYREALDTRRADAGGIFQTPVAGRYVLTLRGAAAWQRRDHTFGDVIERDRHTTVFGELARRGAAGPATWVAGVAYERDAFDPRDVPRFAYTFDVPGAFAQADVDVASWLAVSAGGRVDVHSEYGTFFSPRVSALARWGGWTSRASLGRGFTAATPLTEETEAAGLTRLAIPRPLEAERGTSASLDLTRAIGAHTITATVFTYVRAREGAERSRQDAALAPRHSAGLVGMWERDDVGRVGVEVYFTGRQRLEVNPYRDDSEAYVVTGLLVERRLGRWRVFFNAENLTGVRQTRWDSLLRPSQGPDGRWTVDAWAPLDGRVFNGGVRLGL